MRTLVGLVTTLLLALSAAGQDEKVLPLEQAAKMVNKDVLIEFVVGSTGKSKAGDKVFLNSEADFKSEKNFTVMLTKPALDEMKKDKIDDPAGYFKGKKVQVYGTVKLFKDKPEIAVEKAGQVTISKQER